MKKKLLVIGNGMAPGRMLEHLLEIDPDRFDVTVFNAEPRVNYNRLMLSCVLSGEKTYEDIKNQIMDSPDKRNAYHERFVESQSTAQLGHILERRFGSRCGRGTDKTFFSSPRRSAFTTGHPRLK